MTSTVTSPTGKTLHHRATHTTTPKESAEAKVIRVQMAQQKRVEENREYLKNANVKAFLAMIGKSEGGDYHAKYGWHPGSTERSFTDESTHPGFGYKGLSSASGLYQINKACWQEHGVKAQGLSDFSPATQDLIAVQAIRYRKTIDDVVAGNLKEAIGKLKKNEWVSFQVHSYEDLERWYTQAGGSVAK
ncbi:paar repeat-containing protein [Aquabacterium sp.]|uniref:paar repeat-containing protein n=1 Tax=Aquabacterium sp. TaxID=1872578 RepID=UPI0035AFC2B9